MINDPRLCSACFTKQRKSLVQRVAPRARKSLAWMPKVLDLTLLTSTPSIHHAHATEQDLQRHNDIAEAGSSYCLKPKAAVFSGAPSGRGERGQEILTMARQLVQAQPQKCVTVILVQHSPFTLRMQQQQRHHARMACNPRLAPWTSRRLPLSLVRCSAARAWDRTHQLAVYCSICTEDRYVRTIRYATLLSSMSRSGCCMAEEGSKGR